MWVLENVNMKVHNKFQKATQLEIIKNRGNYTMTGLFLSSKTGKPAKIQ